ncbi:ABC transporter substrate-binding protein [Luteipulveratus flavus]|uniref:ABC transporter substrate-binding protein n=1 Tax=Luteipulveratus flavus TaxID=3031728 RepID=A0ABT6C931_9MICO|nr:ABC transporter substrate-binding protein [Luteipulveratus sp. YIM 133296]MDF8265033.1 ABC transporter substrate-binding protein [Luteipulveratus sp. YIM 133296]
MNDPRPLALASSAALVLSLGACAIGTGSAAERDDSGRTVLRYQGSANAVTLPELAADLGYFHRITLKWVGNTTSGPQDIQSAATRQTDVGGAFSGAVVKLITAGAPVKAVVNYYGSDAKSFTGFYARAGSPVRGARDLIGKKVAVNTLGAHSEAVIDTYLTRNGLTPAEIKKVQLVVLPPNDTEQAVRRGQVDVGSLGGVLQDRAVAGGGLRKVFDDYGLFGTFDGGQYVLRNDFTAQHPEAAKDFVTGVGKAIEWERSTPRAQVIKRFTSIIAERGRGETTTNLKYWKSVGIPARGGVVSDRDYTQWTSWLESSGIVRKGGLQPKDLYTNEFNDLAGGGAR